MLFRPRLLRLLPRYRRLMRDGVKAEAIVVRNKPWGWVVNHRIPNARLTLKVHFDDGTTATVDRVERTAGLGGRHVVGSAVPMRYEATDRAHLEIDVPALRRKGHRDQERLEQSLVRDAEEKLKRRRED